MAASPRGLAPADLAGIQEALATGRRPKVVFTAAAGQMAGNAGQVVELLDPSSDEWIVVQFGRDKLPFSPIDLAMPVRAAAARKSTARPEARAQATAPDLPGPAPKANPKSASAPALKPAPAASVPAPRKEAAVTPVATPAASNTAPPTAAAAPTPAPLVAPKPAKTPKPKAPASLVVTLAYADREWTVAAMLGSKALAKPYSITPTEALRMVALIDVPGVHDAVEHIIAAERAEAEQRAIRLRQELADLESRLAELSR
jgi:hypothetical protein